MRKMERAEELKKLIAEVREELWDVTDVLNTIDFDGEEEEGEEERCKARYAELAAMYRKYNTELEALEKELV